MKIFSSKQAMRAVARCLSNCANDLGRLKNVLFADADFAKDQIKKWFRIIEPGTYNTISVIERINFWLRNTTRMQDERQKLDKLALLIKEKKIKIDKISCEEHISMKGSKKMKMFIDQNMKSESQHLFLYHLIQQIKMNKFSQAIINLVEKIRGIQIVIIVVGIQLTFFAHVQRVIQRVVKFESNKQAVSIEKSDFIPVCE